MNVLFYSRKRICIGIIKGVAFLLIFLILFQGVTDLFRTKNMFYSISPIFDLPNDTVDVLFVGNSHMNCTISPMDLWNDYGITSFNAAASGQTIPTTYFELRELLKKQMPQIVVLEIFYIYQKNMMSGEGEEILHRVVDNVPLSFGISEAIQTLIHEDHDKTEYYLNFYSFHNRWKELSEKDFNPSLEYSRYTRGADTVLYNLHSTTEYPTIVSRNEIEMPPKVPLEYLYKIIELCRDKDIQLVFIVQPCNTNPNIQKMMNYVDVVANENGIPYVNFFYLLDETGFDFTEDMADNGHVNYFGNQKLTSYLGEYLKTNYHLEDYRNDPAVADFWNKDYKTFARELNNIMMKSAQTTDEYFSYLQSEDYIITWNAYSETSLYDTYLPKYLKGIGIKRPMVKEKQYYYAVTSGDRLLHKNGQDTRPNFCYMVEDTLFSFGTGIKESTNPIGIHVGRDEYSVGNTGLNLVVYDPTSRMVVDSVNIDLETGELKRKE